MKLLGGAAWAMSGVERRAVAALAALLALRMLGLFMVLPVMMLYATGLPGATATMAGAALGIYGLTQALFQIPLGICSDRFGRKRIIHAGLLCFIVGSITVALAEGLVMVIAGRALQGAGAIASVVLALAADLTREQQRAKTMGVIGAGIGGVFMLSLVIGPLLHGWLGVRGMFWLAAAFGVAGMAILQWCVPASAPTPTPTPAVKPTAPRQLVADPVLLRLNFGIFVIHLVLAALFVTLPGALLQTLALPVAHHWKVYVPVLVASLPVMVLLLGVLTRSRSDRVVLLLSVCILLISQIFLYGGGNPWLLLSGAWLFFCGFNTLEAALPAGVSRRVSPSSRGAALGVYYSAQFLGVFCGGLGGGWLLGNFGAGAVYLCCAALLLSLLAIIGRGNAETSPA